MSVEGIPVFIGSSSTGPAPRVVDLLTQQLAQKSSGPLRKRKYQVTRWMDAFRVTDSVERAFAKVLEANDFFVLILTPDATSTRADGTVKTVCNENLLFEAGAAYGRYGIATVVLVKDPEVEIISELQGIITIPLNVRAEPLAAEIDRVANSIDAHIEATAEHRNDGRLRWLSLMKCKPALQQDVMKAIRKFEDEAIRKWDVRYERHGVLWGPPDDFLLFSVPSVQNFVGFITELRKRGDALVGVDSRLVFPNESWQQSAPPPTTMKCFQLVLLSCAPQYVELAYDALVEAAKDESKRGITEVDIVTVGVATGDADLFFITAAEREELHRVFVENHLHHDIFQPGWLTQNTTSMAIT